MPLVYRLSGRQRKEVERGNAVSVVLPAPHYECEPVAYVRQHLDVPAEWVREVRECVMPIDPLGRSAGSVTMFGNILHETQLAALHKDFLTLQVEVIVVRLSRTDRPGSTYPDQWPGSVEHGQ